MKRNSIGKIRQDVDEVAKKLSVADKKATISIILNIVMIGIVSYMTLV